MNTDITKQMEMVLYRTDDDNVTVSALIKDETIWITQKAMAELFGVQTPAISKHLKNIFEQGELREEVVVSKMEIPTPHGAIPGKTQLSPTNYYNLDAIISVGYRVNSIQATKFRIWATGILKEYMIKGFAMDDERLKQGKTAFGKDYFRELLERVRSIRASERRIWQQITDIFAECSIDYDRDSDTAYHFYATIQNKFHYAITGKTDWGNSVGAGNDDTGGSVCQERIRTGRGVRKQNLCYGDDIVSAGNPHCSQWRTDY